MPRATQGGAFADARGSVFLRVTIAPGKRRAERLPWVTAQQWAVHDPEAAPCPCVACGRAREVQALVTRYRAGGADDAMVLGLVKSAATGDAAKLAAIGRAVDGFCEGKIPKAKPKSEASAVVTFESFSMQWVKGELTALYPDEIERKRSAYQDLCNLWRYVFPVVGPKALTDVTLDDYQQVMREADARATKKRLPPSTRRQIAQAMRRVLQLAHYPARLIPANPIPENALPKKKAGPAQQFVYPDEDAIALRDTRADLGHRLLIACFIGKASAEPTRSEARPKRWKTRSTTKRCSATRRR